MDPTGDYDLQRFSISGIKIVGFCIQDHWNWFLHFLHLFPYLRSDPFNLIIADHESNEKAPANEETPAVIVDEPVMSEEELDEAERMIEMNNPFKR